MLRELTIENLAIIEKASVSFGERLNVFTGETGAGKSILIGGINAILGGRANKDIVRNGAQKAVITGLFDNITENANNILSENGFDKCDELMVQREIFADGKSTARINGRACTAALLREVTLNLINIHGQHDNQLLMSNDVQRDILDRYAANSELVNEYQSVFKEFSSLSRQINEAKKKAQKASERSEFLRERVEELDALDFKTGEEEEVNNQLEILRNNQLIQKKLYSAVDCISGDDEGEGAYELLKRAMNALSSLTSVSEEYNTLSERIERTLTDIEDIRAEISSRISDDEDSEGRLMFHEERLSEILRVKRKYGMPLDDLLIKLQEWREELNAFDNSDEIIEELTAKKKQCAEKVKSLAEKLTNSRKKAAEKLASEISSELTFLNMPPDIRLIFNVTQDKVTINGMDNVEILISVNKGEDLKPMNKIASGGELSRIMLAVKNVLAGTDNIPTMIFDEVDTGISGKAAQKVGIKLHEAAQSRQILCVTHLAQIASMADTHLLIEKKSDDSRTYTSITELSHAGRVKEIARIISGDEKNEISLKNAEELLSRSKIDN